MIRENPYLTLTHAEALQRELQRAAEERTAYDLEEFAPDGCCIGVPVCQGGSAQPKVASAALAISVPSKRFWAERELLTGVLTYFGQQSYHQAHSKGFRIFSQK